MSSGREFNPWTILILLPVLIVFGWLFSHVPAPKHDEQVASSESPDSAETTEPVSDGFVSLAPSATQESPAQAEDARRAAESPTYSRWTTLESAMTESQRSGKPVLIDFNADWCGPCQQMKHQVFEDVDRGMTVQNLVIPVSIVDRAREDGSNPPEVAELQERFQVDAFPTLVVFSPGTGRAMTTQGFGGAEHTIEWINAAAKAVR